MKQDFRTRWLAAAMALALHLAVGAMLLIAPTPHPMGGQPARSANGLVVFATITPSLERTTAKGASDERRQARQSPSATRPTPSSPASPAQASAEESAADPGTMKADAVAPAAMARAGIDKADIQLFRARLLAHIEQYRRYPTDAQRASIEGVVYLHFVMNRQGDVTSAWVGRSSGHVALDSEALAAIRRAAPLPAIPEGWPPRLDITLPIAFALG